MYKIHHNNFVTFILHFSLSPIGTLKFALSSNANIVQAVKTCYKKNSENRV